MPTVSVSDVQDLTNSNLPESIIQMQINMVISRVGACLDANYSEDEANFIALMTVAAMSDLSDSSSKIKTEKAANGASTTYQDTNFNASSFENNQFGSQAKAFDTAVCLNGLFPQVAGLGTSGLKSHW